MDFKLAIKKIILSMTLLHTFAFGETSNREVKGVLNMGDNIVNIDTPCKDGLTGNINISLNIDGNNTLYMNISMEDVHINESIIDDIDFDVTLFNDYLYREHEGQFTHLFMMMASNYFWKHPYDMSDDSWKLIKFKRFSEIKESFVLIENILTTPLHNNRISFLFEIKSSYNTYYKKKVYLIIPNKILSPTNHKSNKQIINQ